MLQYECTCWGGHCVNICFGYGMDGISKRRRLGFLLLTTVLLFCMLFFTKLLSD